MTLRSSTALLALLLVSLPLAAAEHTLKIATISPEGTFWMEHMRAGAKEISERTDGRVELKFYGGGVMGNDKKVLRKMRIGQLQGATFTAGGLAERDPDLQIYGLPMMLQNEDEASYVRQRMDDKLIKRLEDRADLVSFGLATGGFAKLMSNVPVKSLEDLRGRKVWVPEGDGISYAAMEALGLSPVTLPITDVLTGLQTGLIEIIASSAVGAVVLQWHTKLQYVIDLPVSYIYATLVIEKKAFEKLSEGDQAIMREVMEKTYRDFDEINLRDDVEATRALAKAGMQTIEIDRSQLPKWRELVERVNREQAEKGVFDIKLLEELEMHLEDYRTQQQAAEVQP